MQLVPLGELTADLTLTDIPVSRLATLVGQSGQTEGAVSGAVAARVAGNQLKSVDAWEATANFSSKELRLFGLTLGDSAADVRVSKGVASLRRVKTRLEGAPFTGSADVRLDAPYAFEGNVALEKWDLTSLRRLAPEFRPPVPVAGELDATAKSRGTLQPLKTQTDGTADAHDLRVSDLVFQKVHTAWATDGDRITLKDVRAVLYGGEVTGGAVVPLQPTAGGNVDLRLRDIDVGALARALPAMPVKIQGKTSGSLKGTIPPAPEGREREATMNLDLRAKRMVVQGVPTEQLQGTVAYRQGVVDYRLEGKALGGTFELNGQLPPSGAKPAPPAKEGRLRLQGGKLHLLAEAFGQDPGTFPLRGRVDLDVRFRSAGPGFTPVGGGELVLRNVTWGGVGLTDRLQAAVALDGKALRLNNVTAAVGEGLLRGALVVNLTQPERSWVTLDLDRVELSSLLTPWPAVARLAQGPLEVHLRGRLGREWHGSAEVVLERGQIAGVGVTAWRMPFTWAYAPREGRGEVTLRDSSAQLGTGRATAQATAQWGADLRLEGQVRFSNVDLRTVSRQLSDSGQLVSGRLTGRFDFRGSEVRSLDDLTGTLRAKLGETQALQAPALQQVAPFVGLPTSYAFQNGELSARLARGAFRIDHLSLQSDVARMFVEGTVALTGRLDLDVTAQTGAIGLNRPALRLLQLRIPFTGSIPLTVLAEASSYLSNRVVRLHVAGTVRSPSISIQTGQLLTQEAVRFFLNRTSLPIP
jgi:hypothetical protein